MLQSARQRIGAALLFVGSLSGVAVAKDHVSTEDQASEPPARAGQLGDHGKRFVKLSQLSSKMAQVFNRAAAHPERRSAKAIYKNVDAFLHKDEFLGRNFVDVG